MRPFLICSFLFLSFIKIYSQNEEIKIRRFTEEFQKKPDQNKNNSGNYSGFFIDSINQDYSNMILEAENVFSKLLEGSFMEYKMESPFKPAQNRKTDLIQDYSSTPSTDISAHPEKKVRSLNKSEEVLLPLNPFNKKPQYLPDKLTIKFLNIDYQVDYDSKLNHMPDIDTLDATAIRNCYDYLRNTNYATLLNKFADIERQMNLNDWDYYCLINKFSKSLVNDSNVQNLINWFLLLESDFKVKIGFYKNESCLLFTSAQTLYNIPKLNIKGEIYYAPGYKNNTINSYDIDYYKGYKRLNLFHDKPILMEELRKDKTINFSFEGKPYSIPVSFDQNYIDYFATYPVLPLDYYFIIPVSRIFKESVDNNVTPYLQHKSLWESLCFLLSMVQNGFDYKTNKEQFNRVKYMMPEELLYYKYSDCTDRTILFSYLVTELLHTNVIALEFNGHICSAVEITDRAIKANLTYKGKDYIVCDPAYKEALPGKVMQTFQIKNADIIDFGKNIINSRVLKDIWNNLNSKNLLQADNTHNISISGDGSIFVAGLKNNTTLSENKEIKDQGERNTTFIARLNESKDIIWNMCLYGSGTNLGYCISESEDQYLYVFGYFEDTLALDNYKIKSQEHGSFYLAKLNKEGKASWLKPIYLPSDSSSQGVTAIMDNNGNLKYYLPDDHFNYESNFLMQVDCEGNCYIHAIVAQKYSDALHPINDSNALLSRSFKLTSKEGELDIVRYLINSTNNLVKQNFPKSVSLLYSLIQYLDNYGSVIQGSSIQQTILTVYKNMQSGLPVQYSEVGKISEIINSGGFTYIRTGNHQPVNINPLQVQNESRIKLSYINGNAKIDVLQGIKIGGDQVWNDVNYIILDKTTSQIIYNYDNQYRKKMPVHSEVL